MEKEFMTRRKRYVNVIIYNFIIFCIWETSYFCSESSMGAFENCMYRSVASAGIDWSGSGWSGKNSISSFSNCRNYFPFCTKDRLLNWNKNRRGAYEVII